MSYQMSAIVILTSAVLYGDYFIADALLKVIQNPSSNDNFALRSSHTVKKTHSGAGRLRHLRCMEPRLTV
jgi:hypothetical protein